jgi:hypothetical protein
MLADFVLLRGQRVGPVRRIINLVVALVLFIGGTGFLFYLLTMSAGWRGWMVIGSGFVACLGAAWLYEDFINPKSNA